MHGGHGCLGSAQAEQGVNTFTPQVYFCETCVRGTFCASPAMSGHQPKHRQIHTERLAFNGLAVGMNGISVRVNACLL